MRELQGDMAYWDESTELAAQTIDAVRENTHYLLRLNGNEPDALVRVPRPGVKAEAIPSVSLADFNAMMMGD